MLSRNYPINLHSNQINTVMKSLLKTLIILAVSVMINPAYADASMDITPLLGYKVTNLDTWQFAKSNPEMWTTVTVPHSCNAIDGRSSKYFRGKAYYRKVLNLSEAQVAHPLYLLFEGAAQAATVSVNGKVVGSHKGGYTPFVLSLAGAAKVGENEVMVMCDNHEDVELIPVSSDFNKNNGLHNPAYLLEMNDVYASPVNYGLYRIHVSTPEVTTGKAITVIQSFIRNASSQSQKVTLSLTLKNADGKVCYSSKEKVVLKGNGSLDYLKKFSLSKPHLWNGLNDPYLYSVCLDITDASGKALDKMETTVGYRFYRVDAEKGFFLNGRSYPLRGVAMHQDWNQCASAVSNEQYDKDYTIIGELGANFLRLAHYPHNDYALKKCDEMGIIVQTEIPWVNVCGVKATTAYFENIQQQMKEMITNLYNHPAIVFWGMWNELDKWGNTDHFQGPIDEARVVKESANLYDLAKSVDPYRLVGLTDCSNFEREGYDKLKGDYYSENRYNGWYYNEFPDFTKEMNADHQKMGVLNISEYGVGVNPFCHSLNPMKTTKRGSGGSRHDEEFGNLLHESHVRQLLKMPFINFSAIWVMFDFPVADRFEGYMDTEDGVNFTESEYRKFTNDKGLVTRDRQTKKDIFYLYKALWNKKVPTVYITSRRFSKRPSDTAIEVKVYSNAKSLTLYQNGKEIEKMSNSGEETGVIWNFKPVRFAGERDTFKVVAADGTSDEISLQAF